MIQWELRPAIPEDLPFIMSTWLKSARKQGDRAFMTNTVYFNNEKRRITDLFDRAFVTMIVNSTDHDHLLGWVCHETMAEEIFIVHYVYVKKDYWRQGYAKLSLEKLYPEFKKTEIAITDVNGLVAEKREKYKLHFNPYLTKLNI